MATFLHLLEDQSASSVHEEVLFALRGFQDDLIPQRVLRLFADLPHDRQRQATMLLASRASWARQMLQAVEQDRLDPLSIPIQTLRQCLLLDDDQLAATIQNHWGELSGDSTEQMKSDIRRMTDLLNRRFGDPYAGQKLFGVHCCKCHILFDRGGQIGPNLTTYARTDVANMVLNVVNPSATIREGFENYLVVTEDGLVMSGLIVDRDPQVVVLRTADGATATIPRAEIDTLRVQSQSLMPTGLLNELTDEQISDLFAYLRSTQPLNNR